MKFLIPAICLIFVVGVSAQDDCEMCMISFGVFWGHLREKETIGMQEQVLLREVCHVPQHHPVCEKEVKAWWPILANIIYSDETIPFICESVCGQFKTER